jgi:hypothetical protein
MSWQPSGIGDCCFFTGASLVKGRYGLPGRPWARSALSSRRGRSHSRSRSMEACHRRVNMRKLHGSMAGLMVAATATMSCAQLHRGVRLNTSTRNGIPHRSNYGRSSSHPPCYLFLACSGTSWIGILRGCIRMWQLAISV